MKRILITSLIVIVLAIIMSFLIEKETKPSASTRVVIEHHYQTYIAPRCFDQNEVTNFLEDGTLGKAQELNYDPHNECTEEALAGEKEALFISLLKDIGIISKKWDNW